MCVYSGAQERVGNGKVVSVGGGCGCEMKSCLFFLPPSPFPHLSPILPCVPSLLEPVFCLHNSLRITRERSIMNKIILEEY